MWSALVPLKNEVYVERRRNLQDNELRKIVDMTENRQGCEKSQIL